MLKLASEIIPIPMDEFTLNAPTKQVGGFFQGRKTLSKKLAYFKVKFYIVATDDRELNDILNVEYRIPTLGVSKVVDKGPQFELFVTTYEEEFTGYCKIQFKDDKEPINRDAKVSSPAV
jgi:hypothetical protein